MATLREILDSLPPEERAALNYAFEHNLTYYVKMDGTYIGVNVTHVPYLIPDPGMPKGVWSVGKVAQSE